VDNCTQLADTVSAILDVQAQLNTTKTYNFKILLSCAAGATALVRVRPSPSKPAAQMTFPAQAPKSS